MCFNSLSTAEQTRFERAADAIVAGDLDEVSTLLKENPELARARSVRDHRSTLLHYVGANGVEDFRQKSPTNIVAIASLLLDSGAEVDAESDAYGGGSTPLLLTATSVHPERAGVQIPLLELFLSRGAVIDRNGSAVVACLRNGRGAAAEYLASHGAKLDLEAAAGVGRLDLIENLIENAPAQQKIDGFAWACEFGRTAVVEFFLDHGIEVSTILPHNGQTGLHWAASTGELPVVQLLLARGASADARDKSFDATPLGWAVHAWVDGWAKAPKERYSAMIRLLRSAGACVEAEWLASPQVQGHPELVRLLT